MKSVRSFYFAAFLSIPFLFFSSCEHDDPPAPLVRDIKGLVQKGPFISGSSVTLFDLNSDLSPSGRSFNAIINNHEGSFELPGTELSSGLVRLRADGFYFNEMTGKQSASQITLYALADLNEEGPVHINILTHLEHARIARLMQDGKSFREAEKQAQEEVLAVFSIQKGNIKNSESLSICEEGDDNAILLALSAILQGYRTESELTELLSDISGDLSENGVLDSLSVGSELINHAVLIDSSSVKANLAARYASLGRDVDIPEMGKYLEEFIDKTSYQVNGSIVEYPETGLYGPNLLALGVHQYNPGDVSLAATTPAGMTLKIIINAEEQGGIWWIHVGQGFNWIYNQWTGSQTFTTVTAGTSSDLHMTQFAKGWYRIDYYETKADKPSRTKYFRVD